MADLTEIEKIQLETARLNLDEARESNAQRIARKAQADRLFKERQRGFAAATANRLKMRDEQCSHKQGGSPNDPLSGTGKSALGVTRMPDGWTKMIKCLVCRGEWFTPHPYNMRIEPFPAGFHMAGGIVLEREETQGQAKRRVAKYHKDAKQFNDMLKHAKDKLTPEAAQEMDCGTTHTLTNQQTGVTVYPWRPCDSSALAQVAA